mmetsp:Transcript_95821/g.304204  ORF Transcript_95821/g.304204 Transcript_95821/m.304204 type:complete len:289 (+) Transcript_95821:56-922(+)
MTGASALFLDVHGTLLHTACGRLQLHHDGLGQTARALYKAGHIDAGMKKIIISVDIAAAFGRHATAQNNPHVEGKLAQMLAGNAPVRNGLVHYRSCSWPRSSEPGRNDDFHADAADDWTQPPMHDPSKAHSVPTVLGDAPAAARDVGAILKPGGACAPDAPGHWDRLDLPVGSGGVAEDVGRQTGAETMRIQAMYGRACFTAALKCCPHESLPPGSAFQDGFLHAHPRHHPDLIDIDALSKLGRFLVTVCTVCCASASRWPGARCAWRPMAALGLFLKEVPALVESGT